MSIEQLNDEVSKSNIYWPEFFNIYLHSIEINQLFVSSSYIRRHIKTTEARRARRVGNSYVCEAVQGI